MVVFNQILKYKVC